MLLVFRRPEKQANGRPSKKKRTKRSRDFIYMFFWDTVCSLMLSACWGLTLLAPPLSFLQIQNGSSTTSHSRGGSDLASAQPSWSSPPSDEKNEGGRGPGHEPSTETHNGRRVHKTCHTEEETLRKVGGGFNQWTSDSHQDRLGVRSYQIKVLPQMTPRGMVCILTPP